MLQFFSKKTAIIFFVFALFPFVSFGLNSMDTQPFFIFFGFLSLLLFMVSGRIFIESFHLLTLLAGVILILLFSARDLDHLLVRAIASYSAFFITLSVVIIYFIRFGIPLKIIVTSNLIYLIVAAMQIFLGSHTFNFLVRPNSFLDPSRGEISLTPEPTMFAIVLFFWSWIYLLIYDYKPNKKIFLLILINMVFILTIAKSSMGILFILVGSLSYLLMFIKKKKTILLIALFALTFLIALNFMLYYFPASRFAKLIVIFTQLDLGLFESLKALIVYDKSINDRLLNAVFPYLGFIMNSGIPGGTHSFYEMSVILSEYSNGFFWAGLGSNKILSFAGAFIYELGFFGIFVFIYVFYLVKDGTFSRLIEIFLLFVLLNSAIPVAFPLIPIIIAIMYYKKINNN